MVIQNDTKCIMTNRAQIGEAMYVVCMCVFGAYVSLFVSCLQLLRVYVHSYVCTTDMYYYKLCSMQCACV